MLKKTCYCKEHIKDDDCSDNQIIDIDGVIKAFKIKLEKMEKYFIYIQERYDYFADSKSHLSLNPKKERELKDIKESLDAKIEGM